MLSAPWLAARRRQLYGSSMAYITTTQNLLPNIQRLAAQRYLYSRAKRLSTIQALLAGVTPVASATAIAFWTEAQPWAALAGVFVLFLGALWLDPWQDRHREAAADIQEDFDCNVLSLPWNEVLAGRRPAAEEIHEAAKKDRSAPEAPLENWYPTIIDPLPLHQARIVCQRTNCWWDSKLRRRYRTMVLIALFFISMVVFFLGLVTEMNLQKFVLAVAVPLAPTLLWGIREVRHHGKAAADLDRLKDFGENLWKGVVQGEVTEPEATRRSRELQNAILLRRRANPFVFEWIYRLLRRGYQEQMNVGAEAMVAQIDNHRQ